MRFIVLYPLKSAAVGESKLNIVKNVFKIRVLMKTFSGERNIQNDASIIKVLRGIWHTDKKTPLRNNIYDESFKIRSASIVYFQNEPQAF